MSNSIWETPDQKPEKNKQILEHWKNCYGEDKYAVWIADGERGFDRHTVRWCYCEYVDDLIAQADKAERLQKAVDNSREKLAAYMHDVWGNWFAYQLNNSTVENLQRWGIQSNTPYSSLTETDKDKDRRFADKIIEIIKEQINYFADVSKMVGQN